MPSGNESDCCFTSYCPKNWMVRSLVRWTPTCVPGATPMRNSSPMIAPESRPKKSSARSPKSPSPSGRVKRWVTRNALFHLGRRRPVGRLISVKSGCDRFRTASSRSSSAGTGAGVAVAWGAGDAGAVWALATEPQVKAASTSAVEKMASHGGGSF